MVTCPHCGYESPDAGPCPLCGVAMVDGMGPSVSPGATGGPVPAWEDPAAPFPRNLFDTWRRSMFEPVGFFAGVPFERAAARPILYYLIIGILGAFFWLWWSAVFSTVEAPFLQALAGLADPTAATALGGSGRAAFSLLHFFLAPFAALIYLVLWSLLLHLFVIMLGRQRRNLTATVRAVSYASGPSLLAAVPLVGWMVGWVWTIVLTVIGIRQAHRMTTGVAAASVLLAMFVPFALFVFLVFMLVAAAASIGL